MERRGFLRALAGGTAAVVALSYGIKEKVVEKWNGMFQKGDVFTIAGVTAVNPVTKKEELKQFVVTGTHQNGDLDMTSRDGTTIKGVIMPKVGKKVYSYTKKGKAAAKKAEKKLSAKTKPKKRVKKGY